MDDFVLALLTAGVWLLVWALGVVVQESTQRPWYRSGPWESPWWGRADE